MPAAAFHHQNLWDRREEEISDERLTALPATRYCVEHAAEVEDHNLTAEGGRSVTQKLGSNEA